MMKFLSRHRFLRDLPAFVLLFIAMLVTLGSTQAASAAAIAQDCTKRPTFFGIPVWYEYLPVQSIPTPPDTLESAIYTNTCQPTITKLSDVWLIGLAILDILLHVAGIIAVVFVFVAGVRYIISQGSPEGTKQALQTGINALIGMVIAIIAAALVSFIGHTVGGK